MKEDIWRIRRAIEKSEEELERLHDSLLESTTERSLDLSEISGDLSEISGVLSEVLEKIRKLQHEVELQKRGQRGFCQIHGYTYLIWESGKGWRCGECIRKE
jgi:hypothetical protein